MPDLDGPAFYAILRSQYSHLLQRVIFLTGDILSAESMVFLERSGQAWIPKPFTAAAVRRAVAQALRTLNSSD
jgi:CheY-like chemotaxis protein